MREELQRRVCDHCKKVREEPTKVFGLSAFFSWFSVTHGGQSQDFCSSACILDWIKAKHERLVALRERMSGESEERRVALASALTEEKRTHIPVHCANCKHGYVSEMPMNMGEISCSKHPRGWAVCDGEDWEYEEDDKNGKV